MCGWLKDKYGLWWQITPERLIELLRDQDPEKADRAMKAMLQMRKIDIKKIEDAAEGKVAV
jgi:predicted 3-demethylubiquinone-9 3-methyltransferase (glyoxalase superfamily)